MNLEFEWDADKARQNRKKHRVSFEEASTIFGDPLALTIHDPLHSEEEDRWITLGQSHRQRLLVVVSINPARKFIKSDESPSLRTRPGFYPEGVAEHSPGSRSAPWD